MSVRGGRGGNFRGNRNDFRGKGNYSSGNKHVSSGIPSSIIEIGEIMHSSEHELVCRSILKEQVPYFNGRIFLENKEEIGKVDEILGPTNSYYFSLRMNDGVKAESFKTGTKIFIDPQQLLPMSRFTSKSTCPKITKKSGESTIQKKRGGFNGSPKRGSRGKGNRGTRGFSRGGFR